MTNAWMGPLSIAVAAVVTACGFVDPPQQQPDPARISPHHPRVATQEDFRGRGSVLNVLQARHAGMQVRRSSSEACPEITLRGRTSLMGPNSPVVYVDGIRTANTCILDMLNANDVERVEVYPMGIAPGGSHRNSPTGLILVFLRKD